MNAHQTAPTSREDRATRPTMGASMRPGLRASMRPGFRASMRPTLVPSSRTTVSPRSCTFVTEPESPVTQRSATVQPRLEAIARHEAKDLVAIMRLNVQFLGSLVENGSALAVEAMDDLNRTLDRLENRIGSWSQPHSR